MKHQKQTWMAGVISLALLIPAGAVFANPGNPTGGKFAKRHPRRNEVNKRVEKQRDRINHDAATGKLTTQEAQQLKANDSAIKTQEHADVKANGGYLTKAQQGQLNQEENANSKLITTKRTLPGSRSLRRYGTFRRVMGE